MYDYFLLLKLDSSDRLFRSYSLKKGCEIVSISKPFLSWIARKKKKGNGK
jgi:hypothetical protein